MRKTLFLLFIVLLSVAWAAAQHDATMPGQSGQSGASNPGGRSMGTSPDANRGQATAPGAPAGQATAPGSASATDGKIVEGCLGGAAPDFTVTDNAGTVYKLDIPKDADTSQLAAHVGQSVKVKGAVTGAKASASASPGGASASSAQTIQVEQMGRGTGTCPAGSAAPKSK